MRAPRTLRDVALDLLDPASTAARKAACGASVSVCLPARDEAATVGRIVSTLRRELVEAHPVVDEIIVLDDGSTDATAAVAAAAGAMVVAEASVLPAAGPGSGKGNAMWKSLHASRGDLVCWLDADLTAFGAHYVTRLLDPLLTDPEVVFVKGYYERPAADTGPGAGRPGGGGRVTELVARPLISHLFPHLSGFVQPLGGEYAGRRDALEAVPFVEGWGVELGLLVDLARRHGLDALAQVDLGIRRHRHRPLAELGPQAMAVLVTALRRAGLDPLPADGSPAAELVRFGEGHTLERVAVEVRERPPLRELRTAPTAGR
ncbi:MAG: glucosyl-3-phosphoglycerate synthase [Acidimicrobiia bacterium]|nr:glucosyl-3-phosphoglycerate synthase [Acidimicrobiia bacterium]